MNTAEQSDTRGVNFPLSLLKEGKVKEAKELLKDPNFIDGVDEYQANYLIRLLIEAGLFQASQDLAEKFEQKFEANHKWKTIFEIYKLFCQLFTMGEIESQIKQIEQHYNQVNAEDKFSKAIISEFYGKSLIIAVTLHLASEEKLLMGRHLISEAIASWREDGFCEFSSRLKIHLAYTEVTIPNPNFVAAEEILKSLLAEYPIGDPIRIDAIRRLAEMAILRLSGKPKQDDIRKTFWEFFESEQPVSGSAVSQALTLFSLSKGLRAHGYDATEELNSALEVFSHNEYLSGKYEVVASQALIDIEKGHNSRGLRRLKDLCDIAVKMGFLQGQAMSMIGQLKISAEVEAEKQEVNQEVRKLFRMPTVAASLGLSLIAIKQMRGDFEGALKDCRKIRKIFNNAGRTQEESQVFFVEGSCYAGLNLWSEAASCWRRAIALDRKSGDFVGICEKTINLAQAIAMKNFINANVLSGKALQQVTHQLSRSRFIATTEVLNLEKRARLVARSFQSEAQFMIVARRPLDALKLFSQSREWFSKLNNAEDIAWLDIQGGLALLDIGKSGNSEMLAEAIDSFRRALEVFRRPETSHIRWKVEYYLSLCCLVNGKTKILPAENVKWFEASRSWCELARQSLNDSKSRQSFPIDRNQVGLAEENSLTAIEDELGKIFGEDREKRSSGGSRKRSSARQLIH